MLSGVQVGRHSDYLSMSCGGVRCYKPVAQDSFNCLIHLTTLRTSEALDLLVLPADLMPLFWI